jgi:TatA/E family protein of Tat protein translocase
MLGPMELIPLAVVAVLIFGPANLPKLARSFGEAKKEFARSQDAEHPVTPTTTTSAEVHPEASEKQTPTP